MAVITPPSITALPAVPDPADRTTFNARAYPWSVALGPYSTELAAVASNVEHNATEAATSATTAATQAGNAATSAGTATTQAGIATAQAAAAAASAASASNAANVSGTSTDSESIPTLIGQQRTFTMVESSRDIVPGMFLVAAVTASPTTNWALFQVDSFASNTWTGTCKAFGGSGTFSAWTISLSSARGPAGADAVVTTPSLALSGTPTLTAGNNGYTGDVAAGTAIALDTLATLGDGWSIILVPATGAASTVTADFGAGSVAKTLATATLMSVKLVSGTYTVRWLPLGEEVPSFGTVGSASVLAAVNSQTFIGSVALTDTRGFVLRMNASGYPVVDLVDETGAVIGTSGSLDGTNMVASVKPKLCWVSASSALVLWKRMVSGLPMACMVSFSGAVVSNGTAVILESVNAATVCGCVLSATEAIVSWADASNTRGRAMGLDLTGNTIATNTIYTVLPSQEQQQAEMVRLSATQGQMVYQPGAGATALMSTTLTKAAGVLTFPATPQTLAFFDTAQSPLIADTATAGRKVVVAGESYQGPCRAFVLDVTGTGSSAVPQTGHEANVAPCGGYHGGHLVPVSDQHYLRSVQSAALSSLSLSAIRLTGDCAYELPAACNVARKVDGHSVMVMGTTAVVTYADTDNSYYPTVRTVPLNTIT